MYATLEQHINKFITINAKDLSVVLQFFKLLQCKKKQNLLVEGAICNHNYFVIKGCIRLFFVNEKGIEQTTQFALENWWLADYASFEKQQPSDFYIQAVEKSEVLSVARKSVSYKFPNDLATTWQALIFVSRVKLKLLELQLMQGLLSINMC